MYEDKAPESYWRRSWWRLRSPRRLWRSQPVKGDRTDRPLGLWVTDDAVVVVRLDRVQAFRVTTGVPLWTWRPPGEEVVVLVSADARDGVGVVLHYDDGERSPARVRLTALDLGSGKVTWSRKQDRERLGPIGARSGGSALGGGRVATADHHWEHGTTLRALDPRTGATEWEHPLADPRVGRVAVLLAEPFVALLEGRGARGRPRLLVVGEDGAEAATITLPQGYERFGERLAVAGGVLAVGLVPADTDERDKGTTIGAFDLSSGRPLWEWRGKGSSYATVLALRGWLLVVHRYGDRLSVLDPADGRVVARRRLRGYGFHSRGSAYGDVIALSCETVEDGGRTRVFRWS
ncbi:PQQ-binding-like beta-propeller repeat protein [Streptomyces sp. NPDC046909]|uniref:outer membrane protein assembly factor BamB family protein n=1 Tax=Streptomyces sp. NPDC046909 TaxID=3155617 RepID=UPI0033FEF46E